MSPTGSNEEHRDPRTYAIIGAAMAVHSKLGCGFLEAVYHEAFTIELGRRGIPFRSEAWLPVHYDGVRLKCQYKCDVLCFESVVVEAKALGDLHERHEAQVLNYLKAGDFEVGLLINFGQPRLEYHRFVYETARGSSASSAPSADTVASRGHAGTA